MLHSSDPQADAALLEFLTAPTPPTRKTFLPRRDAALDPLLIAAAAASGPHITRNHYAHDFFPGVMLPQHEESWDWTKFKGESSSSSKSDRKRLAYVSRQAPRRQRLGLAIPEESKENDATLTSSPLSAVDNLQNIPRPSLSATSEEKPGTKNITTNPSASAVPPRKPDAPLEVKCMARTRVPTPHGPIFLHLYHNNHDNKEHLAIVVDPAQFDNISPSPDAPPHIRSQSLDAVWSENETEMDRITRGAYVGKLSSSTQRPSSPFTPATHNSSSSHTDIPSPLIRIHSECFTGETVGSMRCDCGEQLDEAIRLISQPLTISSSSPDSPQKTIPGRGAVIYLRQEGRGIGLLSKIRAYNLQDLGHDTVTANLMLGHKADERGYEIAGAIMRDLGLGSEGGERVRVLTNNPDKVAALAKEGVRVVERVPMIPRSWKLRNPHLAVPAGHTHVGETKADPEDRIAGATLIGGNAVYGEDLDKYLRTKVLRMGHMLPLWLEDPEA
ncbi:gtp cyclohydrolase-2 [Moniliophthora roreri]|uniref:GTP cyclohydrolase II n=1 Tax=Moniliophthora roreri TaxID=221103 RepID=A0A0W0GAM1_MONRR|nr:gtp cyclohydrolase-2 [Moniliophthora roreri]